METKKLSDLRKTTKERLDMKRRTPDWAGYSSNPPALRRKTGTTTGKRLAEPREARVPVISKPALRQWITRDSRFAARKRAGTTEAKPVPLRQVKRPERVLKCADSTSYRKLKTNIVKAAEVVAVPSAHDLARTGTAKLDVNRLVTWLGIIAHGRTVHGEVDKTVTAFEPASQVVPQRLAFTDKFASKHARIVKEYKRVAGTSGSLWSVVESGAKNCAATPIASVDEFRQFLLKTLRRPKVAGMDWSLGYVDHKKRWSTRFGRPLYKDKIQRGVLLAATQQPLVAQ